MPGWRSSRERSPPVCRQERSGRLHIASLSVWWVPGTGRAASRASRSASTRRSAGDLPLPRHVRAGASCGSWLALRRCRRRRLARTCRRTVCNSCDARVSQAAKICARMWARCALAAFLRVVLDPRQGCRGCRLRLASIHGQGHARVAIERARRRSRVHLRVEVPPAGRGGTSTAQLRASVSTVAACVRSGAPSAMVRGAGGSVTVARGRGAVRTPRS